MELQKTKGSSCFVFIFQILCVCAMTVMHIHCAHKEGLDNNFWKPVLFSTCRAQEIKLRSSGLSGSTLTYWAISPVLQIKLYSLEDVKQNVYELWESKCTDENKGLAEVHVDNADSNTPRSLLQFSCPNTNIPAWPFWAGIYNFHSEKMN